MPAKKPQLVAVTPASWIEAPNAHAHTGEGRVKVGTHILIAKEQADELLAMNRPVIRLCEAAEIEPDEYGDVLLPEFEEEVLIPDGAGMPPMGAAAFAGDGDG